MRVFRLDLEYDGGGFAGFQLQPDARTVQGELERALADLLGAPQRVAAAGRTDAGCHARGQVVSVGLRTALAPAALMGALNARLPDDVRLTAAREERPDFHARRSAVARRYSYRLLDRPSALWSRLAWWPRRAVDGTRLGLAAQALPGEHDFASFASAGGTPGTTRCRVLRAGWCRWEAGWMFDVTADHFLYHMVRALVGTSLELQAWDDPAGGMAGVIAALDRRRAGPTAPPQGLCLERVYYPSDALE
jgi:tRNA pseudouridine38-40 synthase